MASADAASAFRHAPQGFFTANDTLNRLPDDLFTGMVLDLLQSTATRSGAVPPASYVEKSGVSLGDVSSCLQALSFVFRVLAAHQLSDDQISALLQQETDLSEAKRRLIAQLWAESNKSSGAASKLSAVSRTLSLGRLVHLSWRVGVSISSSANDSLAAPFVTLAFEIALPAGAGQGRTQLSGSSQQQTPLASAAPSSAGSTRTYIVECTHHEFQEVRKHFQDIFAQLDAI